MPPLGLFDNVSRIKSAVAGSQLAKSGGAKAIGLTPGWGVASLVGLTALDYFLSRQAPHDEETERKIVEVTTGGVWNPLLALGRAFVGGHVIYANRRDDPLADVAQSNRVHIDVAYLVAGRACDAIEGLWVDGTRVAIHRAVTATGAHITCADDTRYRNRLEVFEYFDADGMQGASLKDAYPTDWTDVPRLTGWSWVHLRLIQNYRDEERVWEDIPEVQFLIRGAKATWPGQAVPVWTENAAALRYFYRSLVYGETEADIDRPTFDRAITTCAEAQTSDILTAPFTYNGLEGQTRTWIRGGTEASATYAPGNALARMDLNITSRRLTLRASGSVNNCIAHWLRNHRAHVRITVGEHVIDLAPEDIVGEVVQGTVPVSAPAPASNPDHIDLPPFASQPRYTAVRYQLTQEQVNRLTAAAQVSLHYSAPRYTINGPVEYRADVERVEADMDFAMQGMVVDYGTKFYYEPGANPDPADQPLVIEAEDIEEVGEFYVSPDLVDRLNALHFDVNHAAQRDWQKGRVRHEDAAALAADGNVPLEQSLPPLALVSDLNTAHRLAEITLRQLRLFRGGTYRIKPKAQFAALALRPGRRIILTDPSNKVAAERFLVTRTHIEEDRTISIFARVDPVTIFAPDTYVEPADTERPPLDSSIPAPLLTITGLTDTGAAIGVQQGGYERIDLEWLTEGQRTVNAPFTALPVPMVTSAGAGEGAAIEQIVVDGTGRITAITWASGSSGYAVGDVLTLTQGDVTVDYALVAADVAGGVLNNLAGKTLQGQRTEGSGMFTERAGVRNGLHLYELPYAISGLTAGTQYKVVAHWRTREDVVGLPAEAYFTTSSYPAPPLTQGLSVVELPTEAHVSWYMGSFRGYGRAELRYGSGKDVGQNLIGEVVVIPAPGSYHKLTGLTEQTEYWVQVRFVNQADVATGWDDAASLLFRTASVTSMPSLPSRITSLAIDPSDYSTEVEFTTEFGAGEFAEMEWGRERIFSVDIALGKQSSYSSWSGAIKLPDAIAPQDTWWRQVFFFHDGSIQMRTSGSATAPGTPAGPDLSDEWEERADALIVTFPDGSQMDLSGPNNADSTNRDASEPYGWTPANGAAFGAKLAALADDDQVNVAFGGTETFDRAGGVSGIYQSPGILSPLEPATTYELRAFLRNYVGQASPPFREADGSLPSFTTIPPRNVVSGIRFDQYVAHTLTEGDMNVDIGLPSAIGGTPDSYRLTGVLPAGLMYRAAQQDIAGDLTAPAGTYRAINWQALDADGVVVASTPVIIEVRPAPAPPAPLQVAFDAGVTVLDFVQGQTIADTALPTAAGPTGIVYELTDDLPPGLAHDATDRELTGRPTKIGTTLISYRAYEQSNRNNADEKLILIRVSAKDITAVSFPNSDRIIPHQFTLNQPIVAFNLPTATGPDLIDYAITAGAFPAGLEEQNGRIVRGTPTAMGEFRIVYRASERGNPDNYAEVFLFITVDRAATVAPGVPERLRNNDNNTGRTFIEILWNASETQGRGTAEYYQARWREAPPSGAAGKWNYGPQLAPTGLRYTIPNLTPGRRWQVQLLAGNTAGQSAWSNDAANQEVYINTLSSDPFRILGDIPAIDGTVGVAIADGIILPTAVGGTPDSDGDYEHDATQKPGWVTIDAATREVSGTPDVDGLQSITWQIADSGGSPPIKVSIPIYIEPVPVPIPQHVYRLTETNEEPALNNGATAIDVRANRLNDMFVPDDWLRRRPRTTQGMPYLWEAIRSKLSNVRAWGDFAGVSLIEHGGQAVAPIVFAAGDTTVNINAGGNVLTPAVPALPRASGGLAGATLAYSTAGLPAFLEVETDPSEADFAQVKVRTGQRAPESSPLIGRPQSFQWIVTDGTTTEFVPIIYFIRPKSLRTVPPIPESVLSSLADDFGSFRISWSSAGDFFTRVEWDYLESAKWHFEDRKDSYAQDILVRTQQRSSRYRWRIQHISPLGEPGPWYVFTD